MPNPLPALSLASSITSGWFRALEANGLFESRTLFTVDASFWAILTSQDL